MNDIVTEPPAVPSLGPDLTALLAKASLRLSHGYAAVRAIELAVALDYAMDRLLATVIGADEPWAVGLLSEKVFGRLRPHDRLDVLGEVLKRYSVAGADGLVRAIQGVSDLRNRIAHSGLDLSDDDGDPATIVLWGYRNGKLTAGPIDPELVVQTLAEGKSALETLSSIGITS